MNSYPMVIFKDREEDCFLAYAPDLPGCMSHGDTEEEALESVKSAILEWIDEANRLGRPVPKPFSGREEYAREQKSIHGHIGELMALAERQSVALQEAGQVLKDQAQQVEVLTAELDRLKLASEHFEVKTVYIASSGGCLPGDGYFGEDAFTPVRRAWPVNPN